jgi:beta-galactosidase
MFHGGTSFGFMSGANLNDGNYLPQVTSYDYGAPLDEAGHPTPKFLAFRKIFAKYASCSSSSSLTTPDNIVNREAKNPRFKSGPGRWPESQQTDTSTTPQPSGSLFPNRVATVPSLQDEGEPTGEACLSPIPDSPPVITIPTITLYEYVPLWRSLPTPIQSETPKPMEQFDQAYGYILYRHQLPTAVSGNLVLDELHDYAQIYLDGQLVGTLDRRSKQSTLPITTTGPASLDILVENSDRINFSPAMRGEIKGITKSVTLAGAPLSDWQIYPLPMRELPAKERYRDQYSDINSNPCHGRPATPSPLSDHLSFMDGCVATGPTSRP